MNLPMSSFCPKHGQLTPCYHCLLPPGSVNREAIVAVIKAAKVMMTEFAVYLDDPALSRDQLLALGRVHSTLARLNATSRPLDVDHDYEAARDAWESEQRAKEPVDHSYEQARADQA